MKEEQIAIQKQIETVAELIAQVMVQQVIMKKMIESNKKIDTNYEKSNK